MRFTHDNDDLEKYAKLHEVDQLTAKNTFINDNKSQSNPRVILLRAILLWYSNIRYPIAPVWGVLYKWICFVHKWCIALLHGDIATGDIASVWEPAYWKYAY